MPIRRSAPFLFVFCLLLAAMPLAVGGDATAQGSVPIGEYTPAFPDGPPIEIQPISTVPPEPAEPNPNEPPPTDVPAETIEPNPNGPDPNQPDPPAPDEPDAPPTAVEILPGITPEIVTPSDGVPPLEPLSATITVRTRMCDNEGFNPYGWFTIEAFEAECPLTTEPAAFSMYTPRVALSKVTTDGVVSFEVPAGTSVELYSALPGGYDQFRYTCASPLQPRQWGMQLPYAAPMRWTTQTAEAVDCTWFFVQNSDDVNLILHKQACASLDPGTLSKENALCMNGPGSIGVWGNVTLSDTDPTTADIVRPANGEWFLYFNDLPPGMYTVTETNVVAGTAWTYQAFCSIFDPADGDHKLSYPLVKSTTFPVALTKAGETTFCISTNVSATAAGSSEPVGEYTPAFPGGPPIEIVPPSTVPAGSGSGMVPQPGIPTPTLVPIFPTEELDTPPTGVAVLPGSNLPKPNIPSLFPQTPTLVPIFPVETEEPTVSPMPSPTVTAVPSPTTVTGSGNLTIYSRTCDNQGFNPHFGGTLATFLAECPASDREFEFTLTGAAGSTYTKTVSTSGGVINEVVPAPGVGINRTAVTGFDMSYTSCSNDSFNKEYPKAIAHYSGAIVAPGESVTCYWFNVLDSADINISVEAYTCPAVSPLTTPSVIPRTFELDPICTMWPRMGGVTITLADGNPATADQTQMTTSTSDAQFIDLPAGTYTITVAPPSGATHSYMLSCQGDWGGPTLPGPVAVTATSDFTFTVPITVIGETYRCGLYVVKP